MTDFGFDLFVVGLRGSFVEQLEGAPQDFARLRPGPQIESFGLAASSPVSRVTVAQPFYQSMLRLTILLAVTGSCKSGRTRSSELMLSPPSPLGERLTSSIVLSSLDIFAEEAHASFHQNATREGASLFGLMNLTKTPAGHTKLRQWFLRPTLELSIITQRQDAIKCLLNQENGKHELPCSVGIRY